MKPKQKHSEKRNSVLSKHLCCWLWLRTSLAVISATGRKFARFTTDLLDRRLGGDVKAWLGDCVVDENIKERRAGCDDSPVQPAEPGFEVNVPLSPTKRDKETRK